MPELAQNLEHPDAADRHTLREVDASWKRGNMKIQLLA